MHYYPGELWYAIRVKYRHETIVQKSLNNKELSPIYLTYSEESRRKDRRKILTKPFFPGYMFIKAALDNDRYVEILKTIGIVEIIRNTEGPIPIPEEQIDNITKLEKYDGKVITSFDLCKGMRVKVFRGPLEGVFGQIDEINKHYIRLNIDSVPGAVSIQVPLADLEPINTSEIGLFERLTQS